MEARQRYSETPSMTYAQTVPIDDLLFKQRNGKFLTRDEKIEIQKYANSQRIKNKNK